jgi:hypothetical protein
MGSTSPSGASFALSAAQQRHPWIYRLIRAGKLRPVKKGGTTAMLIPLSQIKKLLGTAEERVRPIRAGALWGYDRKGQPWLLG